MDSRQRNRFQNSKRKKRCRKLSVLILNQVFHETKVYAQENYKRQGN